MSAHLDKKLFPFRVVGGPPAPYCLNEFYGYRAEDIAEWCVVSLAKAVAFKDGKRRPNKQELKLFLLHARGRVLDMSHWPEGWTVRRNMIFDPDGNQTTQRQLAAYSVVWQLAWDLANRSSDPKVASIFQRLAASAIDPSPRSHRDRPASPRSVLPDEPSPQAVVEPIREIG